MRDIRRVSFLAGLFLVLMRLSIGWQLLYEGLWKIETLDTPRPWSAEGYLKNAQGPFRNHFREMLGDPDDLEWLNPDAVAARWDAWQQRFVGHYPELTEEQTRRLDQLINGPTSYAAALEQLPAAIRLRPYRANDPHPLTYDKGRKRLIVSREKHLTPREFERFRSMASPIENPTEEDVAENALRADFVKALEQVNARQARLSYKERLRATLAGDPEVAGIVNEEYAGTIDEKWLGEIDKYKVKLAAYEEAVSQAGQQFQFDHLNTKSRELQEMRSSLINPVRALEDEMQADAVKLLTASQARSGPVPAEESRISNINKLTIVSLTGLGALLLLGLFTRLAALLGAGMLLNFYLVWPPWPGVPEPLGTEHAFIVNKNFIEVIALLAIACLPTGKWFGVDRLVAAVFGGLRKR